MVREVFLRTEPRCVGGQARATVEQGLNAQPLDCCLVKMHFLSLGVVVGPSVTCSWAPPNRCSSFTVVPFYLHEGLSPAWASLIVVVPCHYYQERILLRLCGILESLAIYFCAFLHCYGILMLDWEKLYHGQPNDILGQNSHHILLLCVCINKTVLVFHFQGQALLPLRSLPFLSSDRIKLPFVLFFFLRNTCFSCCVASFIRPNTVINSFHIHISFNL